MARGKYATKGQMHLLEFVKGTQGRHFSAHDAAVCLEEGTLKKYQIDSESSCCYEYVGQGECCASHHCAHLKCSVCGKLEHLTCDEVESVRSHIASHHGFDWDVASTVFLGLCQSCSEKAHA